MSSEFPPLHVELFVKALYGGRDRIDRALAAELNRMPVGRPLADPEAFHARYDGDGAEAVMAAAIEVFGGNERLVMSCVFRREFLMSLITKRKFLRYRQAASDGSLKVSDAFVKAVCEMPFTRSMSRRRKVTNRALGRALRRIEVAVGREVS